LAGGEAGIVDSFERCIGGKGCAVFLGGGNGGEGRQGLDADGMGLGCDAEVSEFALAGGGCVEARGHEESVNAVNSAQWTVTR